MPGVYNSTTQGLVEKNSLGLQSLFQSPSFGSQGSFLIQSLYLQLCSYSWGCESLPGANKPWNDRAWAPLGWRRTTAAPRCHSSPARGLWTKDVQSHSTESSHRDPSSWAAWAPQGQKITLLQGWWLLKTESQNLKHPSLGPSQSGWSELASKTSKSLTQQQSTNRAGGG